jgi:hypothetical protein
VVASARRLVLRKVADLVRLPALRLLPRVGSVRLPALRFLPRVDSVRLPVLLCLAVHRVAVSVRLPVLRLLTLTVLLLVRPSRLRPASLISR